MNSKVGIMGKILRISQHRTVCSSRGQSVFLFHFLHARKGKPNTLSSSRKDYVKNRFFRLTKATLCPGVRQIKWLPCRNDFTRFLSEISEMFSMLLKLQKLHNIKLALIFIRYFVTLTVRCVFVGVFVYFLLSRSHGSSAYAA